jgi:adenine-specific DNA-methyltransferase
MILNLTLLDKETENKIIELYKKYRSSVINKNPQNSFLSEINTIFETFFC